MSAPLRSVLLVAGMLAGCGGPVPGPATDAAREPNEVLSTTATPGAVELVLDGDTLGYVPPAGLGAGRDLAGLIPGAPDSTWVRVRAEDGGRSFNIQHPASKLPGARARVVPTPEGPARVFVREPEPGLPAHLAKAARAPVLRFDGPRTIRVDTRAVPPDPPTERTLDVVGVDGARRTWTDAELNALPSVTDPQRPAKIANWKLLSALLGGDADQVEVRGHGGERVVVRPGPHVLLKRNRKNQLRLRVYGPVGADGRAEIESEVMDVREVRVAGP